MSWDVLSVKERYAGKMLWPFLRQVSPASLLDISDSYCQRGVVDESGMISNHVGTYSMCAPTLLIYTQEVQISNSTELPSWRMQFLVLLRLLTTCGYGVSKMVTTASLKILIVSLFKTLLPCRPNVVVKWLTLLLRTLVVWGSNLCPDTGYSDWGVSWFFSVPPGKF
jgi:hypothetical protein